MSLDRVSNVIIVIKYSVNFDKPEILASILRPFNFFNFSFFVYLLDRLSKSLKNFNLKLGLI